MKKGIIAISIAMALLSITNACAVNITDCATLSSGTYYLTQDIINKSVSVCMNVPRNAHYVTLDCQNHLIDGSGSGYGIYIDEYAGYVTIRNCRLSDWQRGVFFRQSGDSLVENTRVESSQSCFVVHGYETWCPCDLNVTLRNCSADSCANGFYIIGYTGTPSEVIYNITIDSCEVSNSNAGIKLDETLNNTIKNTKIHHNDYGVWFINTFYNHFYNNLFNNTHNLNFQTHNPQFWNTTRRSGVRIYGTGEIGGNYSTNYTGNGYSDTCTDADSDGFCDSPLLITPYPSPQYDYLPYSYLPPKVVCRFIDCSMLSPKREFFFLQVCHLINWWFCTPLAIYLTFLMILIVGTVLKIKDMIGK